MQMMGKWCVHVMGNQCPCLMTSHYICKNSELMDISVMRTILSPDLHHVSSPLIKVVTLLLNVCETPLCFSFLNLLTCSQLQC